MVFPVWNSLFCGLLLQAPVWEPEVLPVAEQVSARPSHLQEPGFRCVMSVALGSGGFSGEKPRTSLGGSDFAQA
jgi:hypothetical protein